MVNSLIERISHFFAANHALSYLLLFTISGFGLAAFFATPKQYNPEIVRPAFIISIPYEGATATEAVDRVVYELTEKLNVIPGVDEVMTMVTDGAHIMTTVMFEVGYDKAEAKADLATELNSHAALATGAVGQPVVSEINPETIPVLQVAFSAEDKTMSEVRQAVLALQPELLQVAGVSEVHVEGGTGEAVMIELDPARLVAVGIGPEAVGAAVAGAGVRIRGGALEGDTYAVSTTLDAQVRSLTELGLLPVTPSVRLRDIASIYYGIAPNRSYTLYASDTYDPTEVVILAVAKREGESAPQVTAAVRAVIDAALARESLAGISAAVVSDDGVVAEREIGGLVANLITSIIIVGVILLLFLSPRAALVVLVTVPLTFLAVLGIGWLAGETINRITLFALILSLGLLVDASIVVVDTIYDHLRRAREQCRVSNLPAVAAAAVREVGVGLVLSAVTSVVVFLPMFYITGMMGPYMGPIAFFVPLALIASLVIAIVLAPFLAVLFLRGESREFAFTRFFKQLMDALVRAYIRTLEAIVQRASVRRTLLTAVGAAFVVAVALPLTGLVHFQMLPKADRDQFYLYIDVPEGTAREATRRFTEQVITTTATDDKVTSLQAFVSGAPVTDFNGLFKGAPLRTASWQATVRVNLTPSDERDESSTEIATRVRASLQSSLGDQATYVRLMEEPPGPPVRATFVAKVSAQEAEVQQALAAELMNAIGVVPGIVDRHNSDTTAVEELVLTVDREQVRTLGVSPQAVALWYGLTGSPQPVGEYFASSSFERTPLLLTVPSEYRAGPGAALSLPVMTPSGTPVALGTLLVPVYEERPDTLELEGALPVTYVTAEVEGRSIVYVMIDVMRSLMSDGLSHFAVTDWGLFGLTLDSETGETATITWGGEWEMTLENFRDLGLAMMVALFLVYAVLVAQYQSFSVPGFILITVPLGLIGIFFGFLVLDQGFGIYLTATALIGFIALIGIVVNNAIIYLEYVDQALAEGVTYAEALVAAGAMRLRPILLTSLTTVLGTLTIAGDPVWSGLAWSIIFGLSLSTILTLIIFPAFLVTFSGQTKEYN